MEMISGNSKILPVHYYIVIDIVTDNIFLAANMGCMASLEEMLSIKYSILQRNVYCRFKSYFSGTKVDFNIIPKKYSKIKLANNL